MVIHSVFYYYNTSVDELLVHRQKLLGDELFGLYLLYNKELGIAIKQVENDCYIVMENEVFDTKVVEDLLSRMFNLKDINQIKYYFILHIFNEFIIPIYEALNIKNINFNKDFNKTFNINELLDFNIDFSPNDLLLPNYKEIIKKYS